MHLHINCAANITCRGAARPPSGEREGQRPLAWGKRRVSSAGAGQSRSKTSPK